MRKTEIFSKFKLFFIVFQLFITVFCVNSFIIAQSQFSIGPIIGVNFSTFKGKDVKQLGGISIQNGFNAGGFFNYKFAEPFSLQTEIVYTMKGANVLSYFYGEYSYIENYIEMPVLIKYHIPTGKIGLNLFTGPAFAINVLSRVEMVHENHSTVFINDAKKFDLGLVFGGGIDFPVSIGVMDISFGYNTGLTHLLVSERIINNVFSIIASYGFLF